MSPEITALLTESQMSPVMVAEQTGDYSAPFATDALRAIAIADGSGNAVAAAKAAAAAVKWINANPEAAIAIMRARIDARASMEISSGAKLALIGQD